MANSTGAQTPLPKLDRRIGSAGDVPRVQYATTSGVSGAAGEGMKNLGDVLRAISSRVEDRLDLKAKIEATKAGNIAGRDGLPERQDDSTIRGEAFNLAAQDAITVRSDLEGRMALSEYENANLADPKGFRDKADGYIKGKVTALQKFDPIMAQRLEADFKLRAASVEDRIKDRQMAIVRDQQLENNLRFQMAAQDEMASDAATLFTAGPVETHQNFTRMMTNAAKLVDSANMVGPDGQPLFSARERVAAERQAYHLVSEQVGMAWMKSQPDMLSAFKAWQDGNAEIEMAGEDGITQKLNLRDVLGESGYQAATSSFMENIRGELALRGQIEAAQDRAFKQQSDQTFMDLSVMAQDGSLDLKQVEARKSTLEPEKYLALRTVAKTGGASVSDGSVYSSLAVEDSNGQDIRDQLRQSYDEGKLSRSDYLSLYERNTSRVDNGTTTPVATGRDYLIRSLGALSKEIGMEQSASIGQANAEYEIEIQSFIDQNKRQPTHSESRDLAEKIRSRYAILDSKNAISFLPLPSSMTRNEQISPALSTTMIEEKIRSTNKMFLEKHKGDVEARKNDPDYKREIRLLQDYHDLLKMKETESAPKSSGTK